MSDRKSVLDATDIKDRLEEIRRQEGKVVQPSVFVEMMPATRAPRGIIGMVRLVPDPKEPKIKVPFLHWGAICLGCPLTQSCRCYRSQPSHWGKWPDELM